MTPYDTLQAAGAPGPQGEPAQEARARAAPGAPGECPHTLAASSTTAAVTRSWFIQDGQLLTYAPCHLYPYFLPHARVYTLEGVIGCHRVSYGVIGYFLPGEFTRSRVSYGVI